MSGAGFFAATMSPANTPANFAASGFPITDSSTACTEDSADVEHTASVHPQSDASCASRRTPGRPGIAPDATSCLKISLLRLCHGHGCEPCVLRGRHCVRRAEIGVASQARYPLLASADLELDRVLRQIPLPVDALLAPHLVEGDEMTVALGVGEHAVTVEDERAGHAWPSLPKSLK